MKKRISAILILILTITLAGGQLPAFFGAVNVVQAEEYSTESEDDETGTDEDDGTDSEDDTLEYGEWPEGPETLSGAGYMVECNTGAVFYSKEIDTQRYPASTTKILTALIALETWQLTEFVTFSETAVDLEDGATSIDAVAGEQMTMKDALYGLLLPSGNDCANAIAEHIAGSIEAFAELMNEKAAELGCTDSHFANPSGLYDDDHYTTAYDMMLIAQAAFNNSAFVEIVSQETYTIGPTNMTEESRTITNTNYLIVENSVYYSEYVVGGKTGYLDESGRCLVTYAKNDGLSIITVLMYCPTYYGVFEDTLELLDYAFSSFSLMNVSESESRFTYSSENAKISLDKSAQILVPGTITSLSELDSEVVYAYDLSREEFDEASEEAGITSGDGQHLYATIEYSYGDYYLGSVNAIIDDNMEIVAASFADVYYISYVFIIAAAAVVVILVIALIRLTIVRRRRRERARRSARRRPARRT